MNEYKIRSPYSKKRGDSYIKIEVQKFEYDRKNQRSQRIGNMCSLRIDLDRTSTWGTKECYNFLKEYLKKEGFVE